MLKELTTYISANFSQIKTLYMESKEGDEEPSEEEKQKREEKMTQLKAAVDAAS